MPVYGPNTDKKQREALFGRRGGLLGGPPRLGANVCLIRIPTARPTFTRVPSSWPGGTIRDSDPPRMGGFLGTAFGPMLCHQIRAMVRGGSS